MRTRIKLAIFVMFQPFLFMFDRFLYTFLYINGFDFIQIGIIEVGYSSIAALAVFLVGNLADVRGKKKLIPLFMGYYSLFPVLFVRFRSFISTAMIRVSEALKHPYFPLYNSVVQDLSPKKRKGRYFGFVTALLSISALVAYLIAGTVLEFWGFEVFAVLVSFILLLFCAFFIKFFPETTVKGDGGHRRPSLRLVKNKFVFAYSVYQFIIVYIFISNWIYLPMKSLDVTSSFISVGLILLAGELVLGLGQIPFGMLADKIGIFKMYIVGMIFSSMTSFMLGFAREGLLLMIFNFLAGLAISLTTPAEQAIVAHNIPDNKRAEFNSVIQVMKELGVVMTVIIATLLAIFFNIDYIFYFQSIVFLIAPIAFFVTYKVAKEN